MKNFATPFALAMAIIAVFCLIVPQAPEPVLAQPDLNFQRDRAQIMLKVIKDNLKKEYYDADFHGIDIEARFKAAEEKIKEAESVGHIFGIIGQALLDLNDSHTFFIPPWRANRTEYGWQMQAVGDKVYVVAVKPGSDADKKGLKVGDQLLSIHGFKTSREELWKLKYMFYVLRPQPGLRLILQNPDGQQRQLDAMANVKEGTVLDVGLSGPRVDEEHRLNRQRYTEADDKLFIWKMPTFETTNQIVEDVMRKARKYETLILDLRGNLGGYVSTLKWFTGYFFEKKSRSPT